MRATLINLSPKENEKDFLLENGWKMRILNSTKYGEYIDSLEKNGKLWCAEFGVDAWRYNHIFGTQVHIDLPDFAENWIDRLIKGHFLLVRFKENI